MAVGEKGGLKFQSAIRDIGGAYGAAGAGAIVDDDRLAHRFVKVDVIS